MPLKTLQSVKPAASMVVKLTVAGFVVSPMRATVMFTRTSPSPTVNDGAPNIITLAQEVKGEEPLRGLGEPKEKSFALLSVSVQPLFFLIAAIVFVSVGTGPLPSKQFAVLPKPTKSTIFGSDSGQVPESNGPDLVIAILPESPRLIFVAMKSR